MVRIVGHSVERVPLRDLNDVIYYKQIKEYSDHEYEVSKDLKREIAKGRLVKIEQSSSIRAEPLNNGNVTEPQNIVQSGVDREDLKRAVREVLSEGKTAKLSAGDMAGAIREIAPLIIETVRQEISSKLSNISLGVATAQNSSSDFNGPEYVPDIDAIGMNSNVKVDENKVSGSDMESALSALKDMNNK